MIRDLDDTLSALLRTRAPAGSQLENADISFDLPDAKWRGALSKPLTVNLYLYDVHENLEMRTHEARVVTGVDGRSARRVAPPARIDCAYCITTWSLATTEAALEEHRLLTQVLLVLMRSPTLPADVLQGSLTGQIPPYPTVIAAPDGPKIQPEFWYALEQKLKPSLKYVVTLAVALDDAPAVPLPDQKQVNVGLDQLPQNGGTR